MKNLLHPPAATNVSWHDGPDALPTGPRREHLRSATQGLRLAKFPPSHEYRRALAHPHLYDERHLEAMHEEYLTVHGLTAWECSTCGHTNHTPDADFCMATPCEICPPTTDTQEP